MKKITRTLFLLFIFCNVSHAQLKVGMSPKAIMPSTVTASSSYSIIVWIKNKGNTTYTGKIHVNYAVDSTQTFTNIILTKTDSVSVTNFAPGDSVLKAVGETYDIPHAYRTDGNGSTVIIWPFVKFNPSATKDSLIRTVYVRKNTTGLADIDFITALQVYPNPVKDKMLFDESYLTYNLKIKLYDLYGTLLEECDMDKSIDLSEYQKGIYVMEIINRDGVKAKTIKVLKE